MPEDRPCELIESQKVTVGSEQASIDGLDLEISRRTARERPYIFVEPWNMEETGDICRSPRGYNTLLQLVSF